MSEIVTEKDRTLIREKKMGTGNLFTKIKRGVLRGKQKTEDRRQRTEDRRKRQ